MARKALAVIFAVLVLAAPWVYGEEIKKSVPLTEGGRVHIRSYSGTVDVQGWDRPEVEIEGNVVEAAPCPDRQAFRVDAWADSVRIAAPAGALEARMPEWLSRIVGGCTAHPRLALRLKVPRRAELVIDDEDSRIRVAGVEGRLRLTTQRGSVTAVR